MFFLPVVPFVHPCLPFAVPVSLQGGIFSPLHPLGFPFHLTHPLSVHPPLSHALLALLFQETQPAGKGTDLLLVPFGGDPLKSRLPPHLPTASRCAWTRQGVLGKDCRGAWRTPLFPAPLSFSVLGFRSGGRGGFLLPQHMGGKQETSRPLQKPRDQALPSPKPLRRSSRLLQGGAAAGAAGRRVRTVAEPGREMRWLTRRQGEWFQNRTGGGGSIFTSAVCFHFSVLSVITTALASPAGRRRGPTC